MDTDQFSILILQQKGRSVEWHEIAYYGPFSSPEEREKWIELNPIDKDQRYVTDFLSK
jgi:hypothetical protein